jgi:small neutral amino acid transporter SnatA (MarC family)
LCFFVCFALVSCVCFVCFRLVSCVPNVASVSGLTVIDCPFGLMSVAISA